MTTPAMQEEEVSFIEEAAHFFEHPSRSLKFMNLLGKPLERVQESLPSAVRTKMSQAIERSLRKALQMAIQTIPEKNGDTDSWQMAAVNSHRSRWQHTTSAAASGAAGGLFGPLTLFVELPLSTGIMLRGISKVASEWGHDIRDPQVQFECLYVFTLGSKQVKSDDEMESSYLTSRVAFAKIIREAAHFISVQGARSALFAMEKGHAPVLIQFLSRVASLFELSLSEKIVAKALPFVGSLGGATINALFCNYFLTAARYHFGMMHLEKKYGEAAVRSSYKRAKDATIASFVLEKPLNQ